MMTADRWSSMTSVEMRMTRRLRASEVMSVGPAAQLGELRSLAITRYRCELPGTQIASGDLLVGSASVMLEQ